MPINFNPLAEGMYGNVVSSTQKAWADQEDRAQRERAIQAQSTAALMNAQNGQDANMIRAQAVQNENAQAMGGLSNAMQRTGIEQQLANQQGQYQQGQLALDARGQDMSMARAQMDQDTDMAAIQQRAQQAGMDNSIQEKQLQLQADQNQQELGIKQGGLELKQMEMAKQAEKEQALKQAAMGGISGIRDFYVSQGMGKEALELDKGQAEIQEKFLNNKKSFYELSSAEEQTKAGRVAQFISPRITELMNMKDSPERAQKLSQLVAETDKQFGTELSKYSPETQETLLMQHELAGLKALQTIAKGGAATQRAFSHLFVARMTPDEQSKGVNVNVAPVRVGPDGQVLSDATPATKSAMQKEIVDKQNVLNQFKYIKENFKPELVGAFANLKQNVLGGLNFLGGNLTPEGQKFIADRTKLFTPVKIAFNAYRKATTGVAFGEKEMADLESMFINNKIGPEEFIARLDSLMAVWEADLNGYQSALKDGVPLGQPSGPSGPTGIGGTTSPSPSSVPTTNGQPAAPSPQPYTPEFDQMVAARKAQLSGGMQ